MPALRKLRPAAVAQALAEGAVLAGYRFDTYLRGTATDAPGRVAAFTLCLERGGELRAARAAARTGVILAESQNLARQLSNEPANALPPAALALAAQRVAKEVGLRVRVFDVPELKRRKMGGILAVGAGSANPPRLIVLEHGRAAAKPRGGRRRATICLVGKGITFDSGGISIKPSASMDEMKHDMSGAAAVVGALRACALLGVPHHVVGVIAAAENMPSATAYRPGRHRHRDVRQDDRGVEYGRRGPRRPRRRAALRAHGVRAGGDDRPGDAHRRLRRRARESGRRACSETTRS